MTAEQPPINRDESQAREDSLASTRSDYASSDAFQRRRRAEAHPYSSRFVMPGPPAVPRGRQGQFRPRRQRKRCEIVDVVRVNDAVDSRSHERSGGSKTRPQGNRVHSRPVQNQVSLTIQATKRVRRLLLDKRQRLARICEHLPSP